MSWLNKKLPWLNSGYVLLTPDMKRSAAFSLPKIDYFVLYDDQIVIHDNVAVIAIFMVNQNNIPTSYAALDRHCLAIICSWELHLIIYFKTKPESICICICIIGVAM